MAAETTAIVPLRRNLTNPDGSRRTGQPPLLTPELQERICQAIEAGNYPIVAARMWGVKNATHYEWMERGLNPDHERNLSSPNDTTIYADYAEAIERAEARAEARAVLTIAQEATRDPQTALRFLERRHGGRWRQPGLGMQISGPDGGPVQVTLGAGLDDHERRVLRDLIMEELAQREAVDRDQGAGVGPAPAPGAATGD